MSLLGELTYFLGLQVQQEKNGIFLSQAKYLKQIRKKYGMCYATNSKKYRKDRSTTSKSASLRGETPLHYTNEQFLVDSNHKTSFLYIGF